MKSLRDKGIHDRTVRASASSRDFFGLLRLRRRSSLLVSAECRSGAKSVRGPLDRLDGLLINTSLSPRSVRVRTSVMRICRADRRNSMLKFGRVCRPISTITALRYAPEDRPHAPRAMNRQVGPSIVLSVLIVCFFAVALFQHDPPRSGHGRCAGRADAVARIARFRGGRAKRSRPARSGGSRAGATRHRRAHELVHRPADSGRTTRRLRESGAADSVRPRAAPIRRARTVRRRPRGSRSPRQPGSAFTVVVTNETIEDVARRVYGSTDLSTRSGGPIATPCLAGTRRSAGTVLRTPIVR